MLSEAAILEKIENNFGDSLYPGDDNIVYDNSGRCLECLDIEQAFQGKHWKDVPSETIIYQNSALTFFSVEAFRFYLPAYLCVAIEHYYPSDVIPDYIVSNLTLPIEVDAFKAAYDL
ncbi:MAG: DUF6714 family protein, partial [Spirulinaceae cyanobacterium]